jgi:NAD(P)-dependent dehydrogenase (short-subunit alcohol dehydrogenase family)
MNQTPWAVTVPPQTAEGVNREAKLDLLVNNAGAMAVPKRQLTADGFELQFRHQHRAFTTKKWLVQLCMAACGTTWCFRATISAG